MSPVALLLLSDGRLPSGSYAHSGGLESAVANGLVTRPEDLGGWLRGRLHTVGYVDAAFAATSWTTSMSDPDQLPLLDRELAVRIPSAAARGASRSQGRGLVRAARACWPGPLLDSLPDRPLHPVAVGTAAAAAAVDAPDAALAAALNSIQGPGWAATRLLGCDPYAVAAVIARLADEVEAVAHAARTASDTATDFSFLPSVSAPLLDIGAEDHSTWEVRLFAS